MSERFQQFSGLVDNCELNRGEKKTTTMDLRGFWEMIYFQVEDVNQKFEALEKQKQSNWIQVEKRDNLKTATPIMVTTTIRKRSGQRHTASKATASSGLKALIAAKRKKVQKDDERLNIPEIVTRHESEDTSEAPCSPERTFNGGFFKIKTPLPNLKQASPSRLTRSAGLPIDYFFPVIIIIFRMFPLSPKDRGVRKCQEDVWTSLPLRVSARQEVSQ